MAAVLALAACASDDAAADDPTDADPETTQADAEDDADESDLENGDAEGDDAGAGSDLDGLSLEELEERAHEEGEVTVYSFTSRIAAVKDAWEAAYPDIEMHELDINSTEQIARITAEQDADNVTVDAVYISDAPEVLGELVADDRLQGYVPPDFADVLPAEYQEPLMANRLSTKVLMYSEDAYPDGAPIDNLWELTEPEWTGRVITTSPEVRGDFLDLFTEIALRDAEMAAAYEDHFGEPIEVDSDLDGAGEQFLADLWANDLVVLESNDDVADAIGAIGQDEPPIGFSTYSNIRDNEEEGWALALANDVQPSPGIIYPAYLAVVDDAPNPAAARLLIHFMMGDDSPTGGAAYEPFYVPGDYPTRTDLDTPEGALELDDFRAWHIDPAQVFDRRFDIADLLLTL